MNAFQATRHFACAFLTVLLANVSLMAQEPGSTTRPQPGAAPQIEVCFVLDTTGSMSGLIEGAKLKIWSIANQMIAAKPTPKLKIGLVAYRDRGDAYVTKLTDLTEDIDAVYAELQQFQAGGGGDEPESVNQALHEAVTRVTWSADRNVLKVIFLVGDSPPHMDYTDDVKYPDVCQLAMKRDLIVNAVQCGNNSRTTPVWQEIARLAEGRFVAIGQSGDMQIVITPMDKELGELNVALGRTLVPYGRAEQQRDVLARQRVSEAAGAPVAADRLAYGGGRGGRLVHGSGDLLDDLKDGTATLTKLTKDELPAEVQAMTPEAQQEFLKQKDAQRKELQARVNELVKQRQAFLDAELQKRMQAGKGSAFDVQVAQIIHDQARRKGITYASPSTTQPAPEPAPPPSDK